MRVSKLVGVWTGSPRVLSEVYHVWCIRVAFVVLGFGSFLCSVVAGRSKVALRVSMAVRSVVLSRFATVGQFSYYDVGVGDVV